MSAKQHKKPVLICLVILTVICIFLFQDYYLLKRIFWNDSIVLMSNMFIFFDAIINGHLPLWSPHINMGQPIWQLVETMPILDPIELAVWTGSYFLKSNAAYAMQYTSLAWLFLFALGAFFCTFKIRERLWSSCFVFVLFFGGPLMMAIPAQSWGFLSPFRYAPWVILVFLWFTENPSFLRAMNLGVLIGISASGYQTAYCYPFYFVFFVLYHVFSEHFSTKETVMQYIKSYTVLILASIPLLLPSLLAGREMMELVSVARKYEPGFYLPDPSRLFHSLTNMQADAWHGSFFIGYVPCLTILIVLGYSLGHQIYLFFFSRQSNSKKTNTPDSENRLTTLEKTWLWTTAIFIALYCGLYAINSHLKKDFIFLGLRNWGFIYPLVLLGLSQTFAVCVDRRGIKKFQVFLIIFSILNIFVFSRWQLEHAKQIPNLAVLRERMPKFVKQYDSPPSRRMWSFTLQNYDPYHQEGPTVWHEYCAFFRPHVFIPFPSYTLKIPVAVCTHFFREKKYEEWQALQPKVPLEVLSSIAAVDSGFIKLIDEYAVTPTFQEALDLFSQIKDKDLLNQRAIVESAHGISGTISPKDFLTPHAPEQSPDSSKLLSFRPGYWEIEVNVSKEKLLVLSENWSRYWEVKVDGKKRELFSVNAVNKGVFVRPGDRRVEFEYLPTGYVFSFWLRCFALAGWLGTWLTLFFLNMLPRGKSGKKKNGRRPL